MAESPAKKQCVATEEKKLEDPVQIFRAVKERITASQHLIKITTEPPVYLNTALISKSALSDAAYAGMKDTSFATNEFGDRCLICLPHDNIPRGTWLLLGNLFNNIFTPESADSINNTTLDDLLSICLRYFINFDVISPTKYVERKGPQKLMLVIQTMIDRKIKQDFPKTYMISVVSGYYEKLGNWFADSLVQFKYPAQKIAYMASLEIIPPLHHAVMSVIANRTMKGTKV